MNNTSVLFQSTNNCCFLQHNHIKLCERLMISSMNKYDIYCMSFSFSINDGGGVSLGQFLLGLCRRPLWQNPYPIVVYSVANYRPCLSHFWWYGDNVLTASLPVFKSLFTIIFLHPRSRKCALLNQFYMIFYMICNNHLSVSNMRMWQFPVKTYFDSYY